MNSKEKYANELEEIKSLMEEVRELEQSEENQERKKFWTTEGVGNDSLAKMRPAVEDRIPFTVEFDRPGCANLLGLSLVEALTNPAKYMIFQLKTSIMHFKEFPDCRPIGKNIGYFAGSGFEKSLFGGAQVLTEDDAWVGREAILDMDTPIESLEAIDFYKNPVMQTVHEHWEIMNELTEPDFKIIFPQWNRTSWGIAWQMIGIEDLLMDYAEDPQWVADLLQYLNIQRENWVKERARFLGEDLVPCSLYNDEVIVPMVSPKLYQELILPSDKDMIERIGGANYWHSCGNTTILMPYINELPIPLVHVSPWSDVNEAMKVYSPDKAFQYCMHPTRDVMNYTSEAAVREELYRLKDALKGRKAMICADALDIMDESTAEKVKVWGRNAKEILL